ncbi:MAG: hypothetical protein WCK37_01380 [Candidatus Falkowbacteria bacterium]
MPEDLSLRKLETPASVEAPVSPDAGAFERGVEANLERKLETAKSEPVGEPVNIPATPLPVVKSQQQIREAQIDQILSSGLEDIFLGLSPQKQLEFRNEGEVTVKKINQLMDSAKFKVKSIVELIKKWLAIIPGVNKFFLEQEAKIKTDQIIALRQK